MAKDDIEKTEKNTKASKPAEVASVDKILLACRARPTGVTASSVARDLGLVIGDVQSALIDYKNRGYLTENRGFFFLTPEGQTRVESA